MTDTEHDTGHDDMTSTDHDTEQHGAAPEIDTDVEGGRLPRREPLLPGWEAADEAARQVGATVTHGDQLLCYVRRTLAHVHDPARTVAISLAFGLLAWELTGRLGGLPEHQARLFGLVAAAVCAVLCWIALAVLVRMKPRREVELILAPDATDLRCGMAGGGVTRRDVDAGVQLAACEVRAAGRLVLDTSSATRPAAMRPEDIHEVLVAGLGRVDEVLVVAPAGILTAGMRTLVRTAIRRGVPVSCWHHDPRTPGSGLAGTR